jgi:PLP dependent protein
VSDFTENHDNNALSLDIKASLNEVRAQIASAAHAAQRKPEHIQLLAVSKKKPLSAIEAAWQAGQRSFGENYVDEALEKITTWQSKHIDKAAEWHFIGAIQSRKAAAIAQHFDWAHSVDRFKVAKKLNDNRPSSKPPLSVCIQVNLDAEQTKAGIALSEVAELAGQIAELPALRLRGLMSIPAPRQSESEQRAVFRQLAQAQAAMSTAHPQLDTLSMGMSADMATAIAEGATIVRVGTAIFGARDG